jgi:hypothetical protein
MIIDKTRLSKNLEKEVSEKYKMSKDEIISTKSKLAEQAVREV